MTACVKAGKVIFQAVEAMFGNLRETSKTLCEEDGNHRIILSLLHVPFISDFPYVYLGVKFRGKEQVSLSADNPTFRGQPASTRQALHKHPFRGVQQCFYLVLGCIRIVMGVID